MDLTSIFEPISRELAVVEAQLQAEMKAERENEQIQTASCHILEAGGKRLRPALLLLVAHLGHYEEKRALRAGVVVEQIHLATLIHDDVVDGAKLRRGKTAVNHKWNNKFAVLLGDYLYSSAFLTILSDPDGRIVEAVVSATKAMTKGELLQAIMNGNTQITEAEYYQIIEAKTAKLISACCRIGACVAGFKPPQVEELTKFGYHLGMAFQLTDDILDVVSSTERLGKAAGNDAREGNYTLPLIITLARANSADHHHLSHFLTAAIDDNSWANIAEFISRYEGVEYALSLAREHVFQAHECLNKIKDGSTLATLHQIADYITSRDF